MHADGRVLDPADPLHPERRTGRGRALGVDPIQPRRQREEAASSAARSPSHRRADEAARIVEAAWAQDEDWGTLVWLVMVTGMRRAEVLALRWSDVDLDERGARPSVATTSARAAAAIEKDTKTHQMRRLALDAETVDVLAEHRGALRRAGRHLASSRRGRRSCSPTGPLHDRPADPSGVSTGTAGCAPSSASTATCTRYGTTRRPSCSPRASTCGSSNICGAGSRLGLRSVPEGEPTAYMFDSSVQKATLAYFNLLYF